MKKLLSIFFVTVLIGTSSLFAQDTLTVMYVNDTHSNLTPHAPRDASLNGTQGGMARAASVIGLNKMTETNVLTLHGGDFSIGDLFYNFYFGVPELKLMKAIGFDAMVLGNHEFDLTPFTLMEAFDSAFTDGSFSILSANLNMDDPAVAHLRDFVNDYTIKNIGGIKVGIFGLTTPETNVFSLPSPAYIDESLPDIIGAMITLFLTNDCDFIICLSHLGIDLDKTLASAIPGVDLIISAHDHFILEEPAVISNIFNSKTYIVQAGAFYENVGKIQFEIDGSDVKYLNNQIIPLDESIPEEPTVKAALDELAAGIEYYVPGAYTQQIGYATEYFEEVAPSVYEGKAMDTPVGNLVTDAFRWKKGTDIAIQVGGSTAQPIYEGPIVPADVFRTLGYGFNTVNGLGYRMATFDINGTALYLAFETVLAMVELNDEMLPQVSGMVYDFDINRNPGERLNYMLIGGRQVNPVETYSVTGNEFLVAALQDVFQIPISNIQIEEELTEFQVLVEYISTLGTISPQSDGRITDLKEEKDEVLMTFELEQNYPNPFNPSTTISFVIPGNQKVSLKIYNILGQEVATLVNKNLKAGKYNYTWNAKGMASGTYIYSLTTDKYQQAKKMILLK